jgi:nucleoside-diphosphate-sugar epimerase
VAQFWKAAGESVAAVTRSQARSETLWDAGIQPIVADIRIPESMPALPAADEVLFAVGHEPGHLLGLQTVLSVLAQHPPRRFIYISSTGVYGQVAGEKVDEESPCQPTRAGGVTCLAAEEAVLTSSLSPCSLRLRLAGIYGPGRVPRIQDIVAGAPIAARSDGWLNLVHVDDAAQIIAMWLAEVQPPRLYVVSDGQPVLRREYYEELARLLAAPPPRFAPAAAESPGAQRAGSDKRIDPARLFADMPIKLRFPSYREGLAAILRAK